MTDTKHKISIADYQRLKWACRRGMLELDVLLGIFLKSAYPQLPDSDKERFVTLLNYPDPEIFAWIMGGEAAINDDMQYIATLIHRHATTRI